MPYLPTRPVDIRSTQDLLDWVERELTAISKEFLESVALELRPVFVEPAKPREGMIVFADGTSWNPGSGKGVYTYKSGTGWVFLG